MTRARAVLVAAFLSAGVSIQGAATNDMGQQHKTPGLRGGSRRATSADRPVCNSIGCPDGYIPIDKAWETECHNGDCRVEQCCEAMCACYGCPDNYTPNQDEADELCHGGVCTAEQCCETAAPTCNSIGCPNGYTPIDKAWETECSNGDCRVEQCCQAMCACYGCPDNYVPIKDADIVFCDDGRCTTEQCCDHHEGRREDPKRDEEDERCAGFSCPRNTEPREEVRHDLCVGACGCTPEQCCEDNEGSRPERETPEDRSAFCKDFDCPPGYYIADGVDYVECFAEECERDECCAKDREVPEEPEHAYCSSVRCPRQTHRLVEGADTKRCKVVDFMAPTPPRNEDRYGSYSYEFMDYDDDYFPGGGGGGGGGGGRGGGGRGGYSYDYGYYGEEEEGRGSDMSPDWGDYTSWMEEEEGEEYCDLRTCCAEKEYGVWGLE